MLTTSKIIESKRMLIATGAILMLLGYGSLAFAQTQSPSTTKPSDYAIDVANGQKVLKNDPVAAKNAQEVKDSEGKSGEVDNQQSEVKETVEPEEAEEADSKDDEVSGNADQEADNSQTPSTGETSDNGGN